VVEAEMAAKAKDKDSRMTDKEADRANKKLELF